MILLVLLSAAEPAVAQTPQIADVQRQLEVLGYDPGPIDGVMGSRTRQAIVQFQSDRGLPRTGDPTADTVKELRTAFARRAAGVQSSPEPDRKSAPPGPQSSGGGSLLWWVLGGGALVFYLARRGRKEKRNEISNAAQRTASGTDFNVRSGAPQARSYHPPDPLAEFIVGRDRPIRTATPSPRSNKAEWIPAGGSARVAGFDIGGMVYVGDPRCADRHWQMENCVIDPSARVAGSGADYAGTRMSYWPCYAEIDPTCRRAYLEWLAGGRDDPRAYIGYVFLYFYGLERRLFVDSPAEDEKRAIFDEVERLHGIYGGDSSFDGYSRKLLDCRPILLKGEAAIEPLLEHQRSWDLPLPVKLGVGRLIAQGEPVSAEWLVSWWLTHPETRLRMPAKRAFEEFRSLFLNRIRQRYPKGIEVKRPRSELSHRYWAASGSFKRELDHEIKGIPDISRIKGRRIGPLGAAERVASACMEALAPYSRYLGRNPEGHGDLEAHALLPFEIRAAISNPALDALKEWTTAAKANGPLPVEELIERVMGEMPERVTRGMLAKASSILMAAETGLAPDPAFAFITPSRGDLVVLFSIGEMDPPAEAEKKEYQAALLMLTLGALVAHADGRIDPVERRHLLDHIERARNLSDAYKARLRANLDWLLDSPPDLRTLKKHFVGLGGDEKAAVGRLLIAIAGADGAIDPSEVAVIEKIFDGLGLPAESLYSELHALSASSLSDEPVTVRPRSRGRDGYAIPEPPAEGRAGGKNQIFLDQSRIAAIMAETTKVSATLGAIFTEEAEQTSDGPDEFEDSDEILFGPDPKHDALIRALLARSQWAAEEFARLARQFELMPDGALEAINEWAFEVHEDLLIEGDQILEINVSVAERIGPMEKGATP